MKKSLFFSLPVWASTFFLLFFYTFLSAHWVYPPTEAVFTNAIIEINIEPETPTDFCNDTLSCVGSVSINFEVSGACTSGAVVVTGLIDLDADGASDGAATVSGSYPDYVISGTYAIGSHQFIINVADDCGEVAVRVISFAVVDCEVPVPECHSGVVVEPLPVFPEGEIEIWATDLLTNNFIEDCSGLLGFSIHKVLEIEEGIDTVAYPHPSIFWICDDTPIFDVRVYAWDNAYNPYSVQPDGTVGGANYDYCQSTVQIQDWFEWCNSHCHLAGNILTEDDEPLEGISVFLSGDYTEETTTSSSGYYQFPEIPEDAAVTISPFHNIDALNGVSTLDLVLIAKHILGNIPLDSPYKKIAADVNNSGSISTMDLIILRKLILGVYTEFPNNTSWRFINANYEFSNGNPFAEEFSEVASFNDCNGDLNVDFIAIKIGDVNGNAVVN